MINNLTLKNHNLNKNKLSSNNQDYILQLRNHKIISQKNLAKNNQSKLAKSIGNQEILYLKSLKISAVRKDLNLTKEQALWRAVIIQAIEDILISSKNSEKVKVKNEAIEWIFCNRKDFIKVCDFANIDYEKIRKIFNLILVKKKTQENFAIKEKIKNSKVRKLKDKITK